MTLPRRNDSGFTLFEMIAVLAIMVLILGVAMPQLWPSIAFAGLEGEAKRLANFGRATINHCTLMRERFIVKVDLNEQRYYAVFALREDERREKQQEQAEQEEGDEFDPMADLEEIDPVERQIDFYEHMQAFYRTALEVRSNNVQHEGLGLGDIGPDLNEFELDPGEEEDLTVRLNLLEPHSLPENVIIESVRIGDSTESQGVAEIEVTPLGLLDHVTFYLKQVESGEYYTVQWDAVLGSGKVFPGKEQAEDGDET